MLISATAWSSGRTPGSFAVSSAGETQYSIPIFAPPGVNGLTPQLALTYGHHHEGTLAGIGWGISGLSAIHRCEKTWAQNGAAAAPQNELDDRYCLDGLQLRHYSGTYGANGSTYRTEVEAYARVTVVGAAGNGPASVKVERKDGRIYEYGYTDDSRILSLGQAEARAWALSRISDRSGNEITVTWFDDTVNGSYRINRLDYAGNAIVFEWESKPVGEVKSGFVTGSQVREIHRLQAIDVQQGGSSIRRYELTYEGALSTASRSRLASIEECAGTLCRPPTAFAYQDGSTGLQGEAITGQTIPAGAHRLDVNGDGRDDLVFVSSAASGQGTWKVMLATSAGGYGPPIDSGQSNQNYAGAIPIDHNHDGLGDVLVPYNSTWWVMRGSAAGLGALTNTSAPTAGSSAATALDIDGDGREDLVWAELQGGFDQGGDIIKYRLRSASGNGFGAAVNLTTALPVDQRIEDVSFANWARRKPDFNGDGRGDIAYEWQKRTWNAELGKWDYTRTVKAICVGGGCSFSQNLLGGAGQFSYGDFNGDGLTDLFYYGGQVYDQPNSSTWWHALSRGKGFESPVAGQNINSFTLDWVILDWDGDGYDDVLAGYTTAGATEDWKLLRSTGLGFGSWTSVGVTLPDFTSPVTTDIDGDGLDDIAYLSGGAWRYRKHTGAGVTPDLLTSVTDGYGNTVDVTYKPLTASGVHTKTTGAAFPEQEWQGPMTVVTRHTASDGIGGTYNVDHTYEGARWERRGRGFEGFAKHTHVDDRNGVKTIEVFAQLFPHTGSSELVEIRQSTNTLIESTDPVLGAVTPPGGPESRTFPYASKVTTKTYGVGATFNGALLTTIVTDTVMDAGTGTPTEVKRTTTEATGANGIRGGVTWIERTVHSSLTNFTSGTSWCVGRPQRTEQINSNSTAYGAAQTRTLATTWDGTYCRPTEQVLEPDNAQWRLEVDLAYDSFGNLKTQTIGDGAGPLPNRVWTTTWSADGRYPLSVKNPLNETTQRTFDARFGLPVTETDPNGLTTSFVFDGFGRQTRETRPDSTRTDFAFAACGTGCGQYLTASQKNTAGSEIRVDYVYFDNFDRVYLTRTHLLGGVFSRVERQYDDLGRLAAESAPCTEGACPSPLYLTSYGFDLIGRPTQISRPFTSGTTQTTLIAYAGLRTTVTDPLGKLSIRTEDGRGRLARSADDEGYYQTFDHDAFGNPVRVTDSAGTVLQSATFNVRGLRDTATDADLGAWQYDYNAFGEPTEHTDANLKTTTYTWDALGRPLTRIMPEGSGSITRTWTWGALGDNTASAKYVGRLKESQISGTGVTTYRELHSYDSKGRPVQTEYFQGTSSIGLVNLAYVSSTGLVDSLTYPESTAQYRLKLKYEYDRGLLKRVKDFNAPTTVFWEATTMDAYGQIIDETLGGVLKTIRGVEPRTGFLNSIMSGPLANPTARQDLEYVWDLAGNLKNRQDHNQSLLEEFGYDDLHRMREVKLNGVVMTTRGYQPNGNVASHSTLGTFNYDPIKLHAVSSISEVGGGTQTFGYDANGNMTNRDGAELLWFADNRAKRIRQTPGSAANSSEFQYGPDGQRWYHKYNVAGTIYTHVNLGGIFEIVTKGAVDDFRHTIRANGVPVALYSRKSTGANALRYLLRDHVGSIDVIATSTGAEELRTSFYGFGGRRGPTTWSGAAPSADLTALRDITRRGFTDHEHLDQLDPDLIHMNGRVYDQRLTRFVSADPFIDGITNTQGWNRYSYVGNNPLSYVDPSGYLGVPNGGSADGPPERPPGPTFCPDGCLGLEGWLSWRNDRPFANDLTWERAFALFHRRQRARAGTDNDMPWLGQAQTEEDFGARRSVAESVVDWWNAESTVTFCGHECAKGWNGDPDDQFAPQENAARNGDRVTDSALALASMYPFGVPAKISAAARGSAVVRGTSVLGHFPEYLAKAERLRARRFNIPLERWAKMSPAEQWTANRKFLDRLVMRGDQVVLTTPVHAVRRGSALEREIQYLLGRGYLVVDDGFRLVPGP